MPRPLANSNSNHQTGMKTEGNAVEESGLMRKQKDGSEEGELTEALAMDSMKIYQSLEKLLKKIIEAELLNSVVDKADPSEYFVRRASLVRPIRASVINLKVKLDASGRLRYGRAGAQHGLEVLKPWADNDESRAPSTGPCGRRELTSQQIRMLMMHEWLLGSNATVASEGKISEFYARGIDLLPEKWQEVLEVEGEYSTTSFVLA